MSRAIGGSNLGDVLPRHSFGLYGRYGAGKTLQAFSFLKPGERAIAFNAESGAEDAPGGLSTLLYGGDIYPGRIDPARIKVLSVTCWKDMQDQFAWLCQNAQALVAENYTLVVLDSGTALSYQLRKAHTDMAPEHGPNVKRHSLMGELVTTIDGNSTSTLELQHYPMITDRYIEMHTKMKQLPFTFVTTFAEKDAYDEQTHKLVIGTGPKLIGKELPSMIPGEVDAMIHCEQRDMGNGKPEHVWLTDNDPAIFGNDCVFVAKHRFGLKLNRYEPADGLALLQKVGAKKE